MPGKLLFVRFCGIFLRYMESVIAVNDVIISKMLGYIEKVLRCVDVLTCLEFEKNDMF